MNVATAAPIQELPPSIFREDAILDREICERSLHEFIRYFWDQMDPGPFSDGWHIHAICEHLEAVTRGEIRRLIINIPPRHMKSLSQVAWNAWTWAQPPDTNKYLTGPGVRFLTLSYGQHLANRDSRKARLLIQSPQYRRFWGERVVLSSDQNAKQRFETTAKGYRIASSVEGLATGEGGDIIIIDDPMNAADKESEPERQKVIDWWTDVMPTRLNDPMRGAFIIIMQRLHHQDLTGHILATEKGWTHLCLPARYENDHPHVFAGDPRKKDGELLWPAHMTEEALERISAPMTQYSEAGQLQQRPAPREGGLFKRSWFNQIVRAAPDKGRAVRGWDLAGTDKKTSPWTAGVKIRRVGNTFYIEDVVRERCSPQGMEKLIKATALLDKRPTTIDFPQDPGQAGKAQRVYLAGQFAGFNVRSSPETGSKITRAEPLSAQTEAGNVYLVEGDWNRDFIEECCLFPNSDFSDQVDAASRAFARLTRRRSKVGAGGAVLIGD